MELKQIIITAIAVVHIYEYEPFYLHLGERWVTSGQSCIQWNFSERKHDLAYRLP